MMRTVVTTQAKLVEPTREAFKTLLDDAATVGFWLDMTAPDDEDFQILQDVFGFHPLTIEDIHHENQRPKFEEYPDYCFVVLFVAERHGDDLLFREHHLFLSERYVVSVHQEEATGLDELRSRITQNPPLVRNNPAFLSYLVIDQLVDLLFGVLEQLDEEVDLLEEGLVARSDPSDLAGITHLRHNVTEMRRFLGAQRDMFQRLVTHAVVLSDPVVLPYYRDIYDHLVRQYEEVDSLRDLLTGAMDIYLSTISNRLNTTMKQLTVVAGFFLPLTFFTGFFGMNFGSLISLIASPIALYIGIGLMAGSIAVQLYLFRGNHWI